MKKSFLILILFLTSCGYQAINKINDSNFIISEYKFSGNQRVNKILKRSFDNLKINNNFKNEFEVIVESKLDISNNSKNQAGEVTNLNLNISVDLEVFQDDKKIKKISLSESTNYNNDDNKFELKQFEKILTKDLVNKILRKINLNLSSIK